MRCRFCDSELPARALFCGECGRAVASTAAGVLSVDAAAGAAASHPIVDRPLTVAAPPAEPGVSVSAGVTDAAVIACAQCGSALAATDIFCGECGLLAQQPDTRQTVILEPILSGEDAQVDTGEVDEVDHADAEAPDGVGEAVPTVSDDSEATDARFVLQFSTGESATVSGTGLIGRSPRPEPGEFFDSLVRVTDPSRSVSKTHLEFGHEGGEFWIRDRFSGNGTILRGPDSPVVHVVADRRYRVPRGSRVDMGEQFFVVS